MENVVLKAIFSKAQTTIDGGWIISFQVSQDEANQVMLLAALRDTLLQLAAVPIMGHYAGSSGDDIYNQIKSTSALDGLGEEP